VTHLKSAIAAAWRAVLEERLAAAEAGQKTARSGTRVDGAHRPANRGERGAVTAQGYLALGLGQRAVELAEQIRLMEEVGAEARSEIVVGALVRLRVGSEQPRLVALLPGADATRLEIDGHAAAAVQVLSVASPLMRQLQGCGPGDTEEVSLGSQIVEVEILEIA